MYSAGAIACYYNSMIEFPEQILASISERLKMRARYRVVVCYELNNLGRSRLFHAGNILNIVLNF